MMSGSFKSIAVKVNAVGDKTKSYADKVYLYGLVFFLASQACFLASTVSEVFYYVLFYAGSALLIVAGIYRIFFSLFKDIKKALPAIAVVLFCLAYFLYSVCTQYNSEALVFLIVAAAIAGAVGVNADHILITGIIGNIVMIINNVFTSFIRKDDAFENLYSQNSFFYFGKDVFYFHRMNNRSSTDWASHYLWIIIAYLWIRGKKITWGEVFAVGALDILVYSLTGSATSLVCISLAFVITVIYKLSLVYKSRSENKSKTGTDKTGSKSLIVLNKIIGICAKYSFVIFAVIMIALTLSYSIGNPLSYRLNDFLHQRLSLGQRGITENGIHLFSSGVDLYGNYASIDGFYNFIDCSYTSVLVKMGILPLAFYLTGMSAVQLKHKKYLYGALLLAVCALSCIEEHHFAEIPYNFFILLLFADFDTVKTEDAPVVIKYKSTIRKIRNYSIAAFILSAVFVIAAVMINYPRYKAVKACDRLDAKATEIYRSVQKNMDQLVGSGEWQQKTSSMSSDQFGDVLEIPWDYYLMTGIQWTDAIKDPEIHSYYSVQYDSRENTYSCDVLELLITDEVRDLINDGSIVIDYDVVSGKVYSVWYSEQPGCHIIERGRLADRLERVTMKENMEGYSTGDVNGR